MHRNRQLRFRNYDFEIKNFNLQFVDKVLQCDLCSITIGRKKKKKEEKRKKRKKKRKHFINIRSLLLMYMNKQKK